MCAAGLPGIDDVNLVTNTTDESDSPARSTHLRFLATSENGKPSGLGEMAAHGKQMDENG